MESCRVGLVSRLLSGASSHGLLQSLCQHSTEAAAGLLCLASQRWASLLSQHAVVFAHLPVRAAALHISQGALFLALKVPGTVHRCTRRWLHSHGADWAVTAVLQQAEAAVLLHSHGNYWCCLHAQSPTSLADPMLFSRQLQQYSEPWQGMQTCPDKWLHLASEAFTNNQSSSVIQGLQFNNRSSPEGR